MPRPLARLASAAALAAALALATGAQAESQRFAIALPHFNLQYVAGGNVGFWPTPDPAFDKDEKTIEDLIVVESFEPVLDLFDAHPGWATDVEMQGYMLDVMAERHPGVLDKLRRLAKAGRIEIVSFHYSDQLFIAHAPLDWERSADLNRATFAKHDVPLSDVVFCQEGQAGPGLAAAMKSKGWSTLIWPKNLFFYQRGNATPPAPLYQLGDVSMILSEGASATYDGGASSISATWTFVDDGELLATGDIPPYFPSDFKKQPAAIAKYEQELADLETAGYKIATVGQYVEALRAAVTPEPAPPLLDGTWQPGSTNSILQWMGHAGLHAADERDGDVRSTLALAHRELVVAETAAKAAGLDEGEAIDEAFRLLALGEVSDATGINPIRTETEYGLAHAAEVLRVAREIVARAKAKLGAGGLRVSVAAGTAVPGTAPTEAPTTIAAPISTTVVAAGRAVTSEWTAESAGVSRLTLRIAAGSSRSIAVTFPGTGDDIVYTPALTSSPVHVARSSLVFDHFHLALHDGLIGLGDDRFVVKDEAFTHVAARVRRDDSDVTFLDDSLPVGEAVTWVFDLVTGEAPASLRARTLNAEPEVWR